MAKTRHIVLADSSPIWRRLIRVALNSAGFYKITEVASCDAALDVLRADKVELLLLDHKVSGARGLDQIRQFCTGGARRRREIPIVLLMERDGGDSLNTIPPTQAVDPRTTTVVSKPLSIEKLWRPLMRALHQQAAGRRNFSERRASHLRGLPVIERRATPERRFKSDRRCNDEPDQSSLTPTVDHGGVPSGSFAAPASAGGPGRFF